MQNSEAACMANAQYILDQHWIRIRPDLLFHLEAEALDYHQHRPIIIIRITAVNGYFRMSVIIILTNALLNCARHCVRPRCS